MGVSLAAQPNSGTAPLTSVLTATVSGTASGDIVYSFDCTGDGSWEYIFTSSSSSETASCTYLAPDNYSSRVEVTREGLTAGNNATVIVQ